MSLHEADIPARLLALPVPLRWVLAARLKTLSLSQMPVLAGTWLAFEAGHVRWDAAVLALLVIIGRSFRLVIARSGNRARQAGVGRDAADDACRDESADQAFGEILHHESFPGLAP